MDDDVLAVWMDGHARPAGHLMRTAAGDTGFAYNADYVDAGGLALSLSMPIEREAFGDAETRAFFANLLPENAQLQRVLEREGLARGDIVGLLRHLGADCSGSVSCLPVDAAPVKMPGVFTTDYEALDDETLLRIARTLRDDNRMPDDVRDPSPVAGVQSKIALARLDNGKFALPKEGLGAPTTHILKVPARRDRRDTIHEEAAAILAHRAGLDVSVPTTMSIGEVDALLIQRFDRTVAHGRVFRIHQEDFAQALGLPSDLKYQRRRTADRVFDVAAVNRVLDRTRDPAGARLAFLKATLFNLCIGNTDNHAKNHAVLYDAPGAPRFAPLYDMLPIRLNNRFVHELAFHIGGATHFDTMSEDNLYAFFVDMGLQRENLDRLMVEEIAPMIDALERASTTLRSTSLKTFNDLLGREMEALVEKLRLTVTIEPRDFYPADGL